jgi:glycerol-3-phosphate dehydrogenase (NAD(P)+)
VTPETLAVVGGGSWGTAFANLLASRGAVVRLAFRDPDLARATAAARENARYLPGVALEDGVDPVPLAPAALEGAAIVAVAVPSRHFAATLDACAAGLARDAVLVSLAKGLDPATGHRLSHVLAAHVGGDPERVAVLSGPNHAEEIARGTPAASVVAADSADLCRRLQAALSTPRFRVYANADLVGVELCAATKNVIAIAAGASDGLGYGDNAKAALMTRGLAEMSRLGAAFGADPRTFSGLAGLGDLVVTCCSDHSRNRRAGLLLARGVPPDGLEARIGMVAEGVVTAPTLRRIGRERGLDLPLTERVCAVLEGAESTAEAVEILLAREAGDEF